MFVIRADFVVLGVPPSDEFTHLSSQSTTLFTMSEVTEASNNKSGSSIPKRDRCSSDEAIEENRMRKTKRIASGGSSSVDDIQGPPLQRGDIVTRLLLNSSEMARVIGRGGEYINRIRTSTGAMIKACDIETEDKVAIIMGEPSRVIAAFEQLLDKVSPQSTDYLSVRFLVQNEHAGRVVGSKGANINEMRVSARATQVSIEKQATHLGNMSLRVMTVEGTMHAIAQVHTMYHRLFDATLPPLADIRDGRGREQKQHDYQHDISSYDTRGQGSYESYSVVPSVTQPQENKVSLEGLLKRGVLGDTVKQLHDMSNYLSENFNIELAFLDKKQSVLPPHQQHISHTHDQQHFGQAPPPQQQQPYGQNSANLSTKNGTKFGVPSTVCGGLIGRGGELLKGLGSEFRCHIDITKQIQADGTREVVISPLLNSSSSDADVMRCRTRMLQMVDSILDRERKPF
jgi:predicted RNA-binding protein YlqC (UPF0109 family)